MKKSDGLFLESCQEVAREKKYKNIKYEEIIVDNCMMQVCSFDDHAPAPHAVLSFRSNHRFRLLPSRICEYLAIAMPRLAWPPLMMTSLSYHLHSWSPGRKRLTSW